jgi:succinate dehydrogenase (ubiquinone) membrane anchor subunit
LSLTLPTEVIQGTVNDPVPVPEPHKSHGSYHWTFERALSVALIPLIVTPFVTGTSTPVLDALIGTSVVIHSHIGFDSMVIDYIPKRHYPKAFAIFSWGLRAATFIVLVGIYEFQVNEVGMRLLQVFG